MKQRRFGRLHDERMGRFVKSGLYLVTSQPLSEGRSTVDIVAAALRGGVRLVQLREKDLPLRELLELADRVRTMTKAVGALLIINDRLDVALAVGADGVHLGQSDLPIARARRIAPDLILGASSHSEEEAWNAEADGASYVNIGPLFSTQTKDWRSEFLGIEGLKRIAPVLSVPFTVMGGIKEGHVPALTRAGARTLAVVTAVTASDDPERAARGLLHAIHGPGWGPQDDCGG
jgi:thiamine-phosphate pyrophosphorylase